MNSSAIQNPRFDLILCNQGLKQTIKKRLGELKVSLFELCNQLDLHYERVRYWMNESDPTNTNRRLRQWHIITLAESLGINIRITIVIKPASTAYAIPYVPSHEREKEDKWRITKRV